MEKILIKHIMTEKLTVATPDHTFSQLMNFLNLSDIHHLPVMEREQIIGIISLTDLMKTLHKRLNSGASMVMSDLDNELKVRDIMTAAPVTISPDAEIEDAVGLLISNHFHALPVVQDDKLLGIVTDYDLLQAYYKEKRPPAHFSISSPGFGIG